MLPIQAINATSCSFFHKKLLKVGLGFLPGGNILKTGLDIIGGGGGQPTVERPCPEAPEGPGETEPTHKP